MENQYSSQWYESLARDLKSGAKAPTAPPVSSAAEIPEIAPIDFTDDFVSGRFVDTLEPPTVTNTNTKKKTKSKKKKKSDPLTNVILALSICVFLGSAGFLVYKYVIEPMQIQGQMEELKDSKGDGDNEVKSADNGIWTSGETVEEARNEDGTLKAFDKILAENPDTIGWIQVPNTPIDYAVVQTDDNDYYLTHNFAKKYDAAGCPFLDYQNVVGPNGQLSQCSVIYAHHRRNGTMFAKLKNYNEVDFYKQNPVIKFDTIYDRSEWVVFSNFRATTNSSTGKIFEYRKFDFKDANEFNEFVTAIKKRSYFNTPVDVNENDKILLLSTCSYEKQHWRMVIAARKVREGETIDVRSAEKNNSVLWP